MREPASNVRFESPEQPAKHLLEICLMDEGMQIDGSERQDSNADSPKTEITQSTSNSTSERRLQPAKQLVAICSTDEGMQID
jgi:hypothetical protein